MALRTPIYLDSETLLSQAEYHDIAVPHQAEIVERSTRRRSGGGRLGGGGVGVDATAGSDFEHQSTYTLTPREKSMTSKVIDELIRSGAVTTAPDEDTAFVKDQLVEIEGTTRITAASLAGKMLYIVKRLAGEFDGELSALSSLGLGDARIAEQIRQVYLGNELLPIPLLLEVTGSGLPQKVFVNVGPDHFIDSASANRVEGELRVLGSVTALVDGGDDGYLSAEAWLLHDWEYLLRRKLMVDIDTPVKGLVRELELDLPTSDVHAFIKGPAIVLDAVAIY